ncbi:Zinc finger, RING-type [Corchorus olitorius]|uniref:Zinc finger, RING-type n=1 Tax=Corchorus olitorius TaxID=93759 RepID=A0A1R3IEV0_9ROSI|nr:Zinc finger, RING-type [Corchorus olitorius]
MAAAEGSQGGRCSICLDTTAPECDRTIVQLRCTHAFHLDCIGSAFNATGNMQCPNCRQLENGQWRRFPTQATFLADHFEEGANDDDDQPLRYDLRPRLDNSYDSIFNRWAGRSMSHDRENGQITTMENPFGSKLLGGAFNPFGPQPFTIGSNNVAPTQPEPSAPVESVGHQFSLDNKSGTSSGNGGGNSNPIFPCGKQPFTDPRPTWTAPSPSSAVEAFFDSLEAEAARKRASSNRDQGIGQSFRPPPLNIDHNNYPFRRPYEKSPSPAVLASMASGRSKRPFDEFVCNRVSFKGGSSSSQQRTSELFTVVGPGAPRGSSSSEQIRDGIYDPSLAALLTSPPPVKLVFEGQSDSTLKEASQTREIDHIAFMNINSNDDDDDEPQQVSIEPAPSQDGGATDVNGRANFDMLDDDTLNSMID